MKKPNIARLSAAFIKAALVVEYSIYNAAKAAHALWGALGDDFSFSAHLKKVGLNSRSWLPLVSMFEKEPRPQVWAALGRDQLQRVLALPEEAPRKKLLAEALKAGAKKQAIHYRDFEMLWKEHVPEEAPTQVRGHIRRPPTKGDHETLQKKYQALLEWAKRITLASPVLEVGLPEIIKDDLAASARSAPQVETVAT